MKIKIASLEVLADRCKSAYIFDIDEYSEDEVDYSNSFVVENDALYLTDSKLLESIGDVSIRVSMKDPTNVKPPIVKTYTLTVSCFDLETRRDDIIEKRE